MPEIPGTSERIPGRLLDIGGFGHNVRHPNYGAVGDGLTDDTEALRAALEASDVVILPQGVYGVTEDIEILSGKTILGAGLNSSIIRWIGGGAPELAVLVTPEEVTVEGLNLRHFGVDGNENPDTALTLDEASCEIFIDRATQGILRVPDPPLIYADITDTSPSLNAVQFLGLLGDPFQVPRMNEAGDALVWDDGGSGVTISDVSPLDPRDGDLWWDSDSGTAFIWYDDGISAQWVEF